MIEHLRSPLDPNKEDPENDGADNGNPSLDLRPVPTIIMDAGIASEENIQWLQDDGYKHIVVSRKRAGSKYSCSFWMIVFQQST